MFRNLVLSYIRMADISWFSILATTLVRQHHAHDWENRGRTLSTVPYLMVLSAQRQRLVHSAPFSRYATPERDPKEIL
jgi:hypothetical protein